MHRALQVLIVGLLGIVSSAVGQDQSSSTARRPCTDEQVPGRPTLKRRQLAEDKTPTETVAETAQPCDPVQKDAVPEVKEKSPKIHFEGLKSVSESDMLKTLREKRADLRYIAVLEPEVVTKAEETIKQFLFERGYRHAAVSSRIEKTDNNEPAVTFIVSEGPRLRIAEIRFEGNRIFSPQLLAGTMKKYLARYESRHEGGYDPEVFDYCLHRLANLLRSHGYLQARFDDPKIEENNGALIITVQGKEGPLYRLGKLKIEGSSLLLPEQIVAMLGQNTGDVVNGERLSQFLYEELKQHYGERGFIQYTAEITPEFHTQPGRSDGILDLEITIDEGRQFRIRKIRFEAGKLPETELLELLLLRQGDVYNQKLFEQSIERLNGTGLFQFVDKDRDVDFRTDMEEEGWFDITIKLTKRQG